MIKKEEKRYLDKIDQDKIVEIYKFDPKRIEIGRGIIKKIKNILPKPKILFMGSTALGIVGQRDIDIYLVSNKKTLKIYFKKIEEIFGRSKFEFKEDRTSYEWNFLN